MPPPPLAASVRGSSVIRKCVALWGTSATARGSPHAPGAAQSRGATSRAVAVVRLIDTPHRPPAKGTGGVGPAQEKEKVFYPTRPPGC